MRCWKVFFFLCRRKEKTVGGVAGVRKDQIECVLDDGSLVLIDYVLHHRWVEERSKEKEQKQLLEPFSF